MDVPSSPPLDYTIGVAEENEEFEAEAQDFRAERRRAPNPLAFTTLYLHSRWKRLVAERALAHPAAFGHSLAEYPSPFEFVNMFNLRLNDMNDPDELSATLRAFDTHARALIADPVIMDLLRKNVLGFGTAHEYMGANSFSDVFRAAYARGEGVALLMVKFSPAVRRGAADAPWGLEAVVFSRDIEPIADRRPGVYKSATFRIHTAHYDAETETLRRKYNIALFRYPPSNYHRVDSLSLAELPTRREATGWQFG